jgi:ribonuclease E
MPKQIIIAEQHRIAAVFWEDQIQELVVATGNHQVGDIYLGVVENVLPGIDAAFVNIGDPERNGFIHVTDLGPLRLKRSAGAITELLAPQQKVLVQIMKEPTGNKGPRLTGNITLPGRYLVLMPYGKGVNLSRRIKNDHERNRLRALAILVKPAGMGLLVRTEAEGKAEEAIMEDLENLQKQWEYIQQEANSSRAPALLNRDDDFIQRVLRDMYSADVNRIMADSNTGLKRIKQYLINWNGGRLPDGVLIDQHRERQSILEYFRVNSAIKEALKPRVDLPSGGYVIIEPTEALTVIDVNSGSFTRSATARETVLWTNCEAATEIARQLRLRNIAGVIIVDFIDMDSWKDKLQVLEHFNKALKIDKSRPQIAQLSELGLVELTRKRQGKNIYELFGQSCSVCGGLGHTVHLPGETPFTLPEVVTESNVPAPVKNTSTVVDFSEPYNNTSPPVYREKPAADLWDGDSYDDDEDSIDYNPPSYQDRLGKKDHRRQRIRSRQDNRQEIRQEISKPFRNNIPSSGLPVINSTYPPVARGGEPFVPQNPRFPGIERVERFEEERVRPSKPERIKPIKQEIEPPEIVSVEMTAEEQEMYALMGISPLVRLEKEVKNPRTVIVSVNSPGEIPAHILNNQISEQDDDDFTASEDDDDSDLMSLSIEREDDFEDEETTFVRHYDYDLSEDDQVSGMSFESRSENNFEEELSDSDELYVNDNGDNEDVNNDAREGRPIIRRRRRRSSAADSE